MRSIGLLGLALLSVFTFGVVVAASASAAEGPAGLLFLKGVEDVATISGTAGISTLTEIKSKKTIQCQKTEILSSKSEKATHITLWKDTDLHNIGCKEGKLSCNTEGDPKDVILVLGDTHTVSLLEGSVLRPGIGIILLNSKLEDLSFPIKCGVGVIEVKGVVFGSLKLGADVGGGDIEAATLEFPNTLPCDSSDTLCKELLEKKPFLSNFTGAFGASEEKATAALKLSPMVEVDF